MIGKTVSHYRITRQLGAGGMGVVYEALDTKLDRTVALKFLPPDLTRDPEAKARFIHEAKAASALDHPNVCTIHDIGETDDGRLFIVMSRYEGETLKDRIAHGPLPIDEALNITRQLADGLAKAHEREIIHRDIKPANLFITTDGHLKILDFGLAKLAGQTRVTKAGTTVGTVGYMSPEQARGEETDQRSDLWSLGVVLYELVSGRQPFRGDHQQAILYSIVNVEPEPVTGLRTGVPIELERIIGKCMAKDVRERYQNANDLLADLRRLIRESEHSGSARGPGATSRPFWRNRPARIALIALMMAVILFGVYEMMSADRRGRLFGRAGAPSEGPSVAVLFLDNLGPPGEDDYLAAGLTEDIITAMSQVEGLRVLSRSVVERYRGAVVDPRVVGRELDASHVLEGSIRRADLKLHLTAQLIDTRTGYHVWARRYDGTPDDIFAFQDSVVAGVATALGAVPAGGPAVLPSRWTKNAEAYGLYLAGREAGLFGVALLEQWDDVRRWCERAIELDPGYAPAMGSLAMTLCQLHQKGVWRPGQLERARELAERARAIDPESDLGLLGLAFYHWEKGQLDEAISLGEKGNEIHTGFAEKDAFLAHMLVERGDLHAAYECLRRAVGYGGRPPMNLPGVVISVYNDLGRHEEAEAIVQGWAHDYPRLAYISRAVGDVVASGGQVAAAIDTLYHHLTRFPDDLYGVSATCSYLYSQQRFAEADSLLEHALQRWPQAADSWLMAASWAYNRGDWVAAEQRYRRSIELEPYLYSGRTWLGWSIARQGRKEEAEAVFRECIARWPDDPDPVLALANFLEQAGHADEAQRTLEDAVKNWPEESEPARRLARFYERTGSTDVARRQYLDNAARWSDDKDMLLEASWFCVRTRKYEDAEHWAREALAAAPATEPPARQIGWALLRQGRTEEAIPWFEQAIERQPASSSAHQGLVNAMLALERRDDALRVAEDFANRHPGSTDAWRLLARTQQASNDLFQAAVAYERVLELDKRDATTVTNLADLYRTIGQLGKAHRMVLQAAAHDTTSWYVQYELAWLSLQCDDREHALEAAPRSLRAAQRARDRLQSLDTMAEIQRRWGSEERAVVAARQALVEADSCLALNHDDTDILSAAGYIQARYGNAARALDTAARLAAQEGGAIIYNAACIAALVDSTDLAFEYLEKALDRHGVSAAWVRSDPDLASLHGDARFKQLVDSLE